MFILLFIALTIVSMDLVIQIEPKNQALAFAIIWAVVLRNIA